MKVDLLDINFGTFNNIFYFPIFFLYILVFIWRFRNINNSINLLNPLNIKDLILNFSGTKHFAKLFFLIIGTFFLFFSLLSPQWNKKEINVQQKSRDIFVALDISRSMLAQDLLPNRLDFAKSKIKKLLNLLSTDRIGLILFSGSSFVQCPLTNDLQAFFSFLSQADTEIISSGTTSIEQAIKMAMDKFSNELRKNKLLLIFTDGEDFSSNLSGIKQEAQKQGLNIFTVGVGTLNGAPIPLFDDHGAKIGYQLDEHNKVVITKLNEGILKALSQSCGGYFLKANEKNDDDLEILVKNISKFEKENGKDKKISYFEEQYHYFLIISFICFALEWIL